MKRFLICILAVAMLLTLCIPVFADEATGSGNTTDPKVGNLVTQDGAQARLKAESGLRFLTQIDKDFYESHKADIVKMGTLIAPKAYVDEAGAFTKEALEGLSKSGAKYLDVEATAFYDEAEYTIAGSIVNIKENHKDLPFAGIGYIEYRDGDKTVVEYSPVYSVRTVSNVATMAYGDVVWYQYSAETPTKPAGYTTEVRENIYSPYTREQYGLLESLRGNKFEIESVEQIGYFRNLVNLNLDNFSGKTVVLTADLDFTGKDFVPIGNNPEAGSSGILTWNPEAPVDTSAAKFCGTFDGQGHSITGIEATFNHGHTGFFGVTYDATIKNLHLDANFKNTGNIYRNGILIGLAVDTKVDSCYVSGSYESTTAEFVGGIVGAAGSGPKGTVISNCISEANVSGYDTVGGLLGYAYGEHCNVNLENCYIKADSVSCTKDGGSAYAFVGHLYSVFIYNCYALVNNNPDLVPTNTAVSPSLVAAKSITEEDLKKMADQLGTAFKTGESGFPVLTYGKNEASDTPDTPALVIRTVDDWIAFAESVNNGNTYIGKRVLLENDLDFSGRTEYTPVGYSADLDDTNVATWTQSDGAFGKVCFSGHFDGNGHKITGLTATFNHGYTGLFGLTFGATIENLWVEANFSNTSGKWHNGILIGLAFDTEINSCYVGGIYRGSGALVGGMIGSGYHTLRISNSVCKVDCTSLGNAYLGGVVGYGFGEAFVTEVTLENCYLDTPAFGVAGPSSLIIGDGNATKNVSKCYIVDPNGTLKDIQLTNGANATLTSTEFVTEVTAELLGDAFGTDADGNVLPLVFLGQ